MGSHSMVGGSIIGNKNTHVYHMAGDKGALPAPQNRVYFSSVAAAQAAGYHAAGAGRGMTNSRAMMHGGMMTH
jgi:methylphosphotriester-DNA--protein-cysteine methyltransferase